MTNTGVTWAEGVQACTAIAAYFAAPATIQFVWKLLRYRFRARVLPIDIDRTATSQRWQIVVKNRTKRVRKLNLTVSTESSFSKIVFADVLPKSDSGMKIVQSKLDDGCLRIRIKRIHPGRHLIANIILDRLDQPTVYSDAGDLTYKINYRRNVRPVTNDELVSISKTRMMMLLIHFGAGTGLIIVALLKSVIKS